jgi:hypothetical protein
VPTDHPRSTPNITGEDAAAYDRRHIEEVCRAELVRLRRKTASLSPADRAEVDAISIAVAGAIAARLGAALDGETAPEFDNMSSGCSRSRLGTHRPDRRRAHRSYERHVERERP